MLSQEPPELKMEDSTSLHPKVKARRLIQELNDLEKSTLSDDAERVQIKDALAAALSRLETPWETALRIVFTQVCLLRKSFLLIFRERTKWQICAKTQPALAAVLKVCHDMGLFHKWVQDHGGRQATAEDLAKLLGVDPLLLVASR